MNLVHPSDHCCYSEVLHANTNPLLTGSTMPLTVCNCGGLRMGKTLSNQINRANGLVLNKQRR